MSTFRARDLSDMARNPAFSLCAAATAATPTATGAATGAATGLIGLGGGGRSGTIILGRRSDGPEH